MREDFAGQGSLLAFHNVLAPLSLNTAYSRDVDMQRSQQTPNKIRNRASLTFTRTRSDPESQFTHTIQQRRYSSSPLKRMSRSRSQIISSQLPRRFSQENVHSTQSTQRQHYFGNSTASFQITRQHTSKKKEQQVDCAERCKCCFPSSFTSCSLPCAIPLSSKTRAELPFNAEVPSRESNQSGSRQVSPRSPFSHLSRSSSLASHSSACTITSPLTSICDRLDEHTQEPASSDWNCLEMSSVSKENAPDSSPLAYKRKEPSTFVNDHHAKRRKHGRETSYPEVILCPKTVSPWSKGWTPGTLHQSYLSIHADQEEEDCENDEITLLPTKKSIANYTSSLASSSPVQRSSPFGGLSTPKQSTMHKLASLMEDIFEAETDIQGSDGLSSTMSTHARAYFVVQDGLHMLAIDTLSKLMRYVRACPATHSIAHDGLSPIKQKTQNWSDTDAQEISRLIKVMHRGLERVIGLDPFPQINKGLKRASPVKKSSGKRRSSTSADDDLEHKEDAMLSGAMLDQVTTRLGRIAHALLIADNCFTILTKEGTSRLLLCEETILPSLQLIKTALDNVVVPFAETCGGVASCSNVLLQELVSALGSMQASPEVKSTHSRQITICKNHLATIFGHLLSSLPRMESLLKKPELVLSETMAFVLANSLLPPFFIQDPETSASSTDEQLIKSAAMQSLCAGELPMKTLRLSAIHIIRLTYERSEEQKLYIVTTILDSMHSISDSRKQGKKQFGLSNGKSICSSTALLLQIIQASSKPIAKAIKMSTMEWEDDSEEDEAKSDGTAAESDIYKIEVLREGQDMARRAAAAVAECLMHKIISEATVKGAKSMIQSEAKFATVMESLVTDLLNALSCPEWPASSLLLRQLSVQFCNYLDEEKGNHEVRSVALDQLGFLAMRLSESKMRCQSTEGGMIDVTSIRENKEYHSLDRLNNAYWTVIDYLKQRTDEDGSMDSAARFLEAQWGREMVLFLYNCVDMVDDLTRAEDEENLLLAEPFVRHVDIIIGRMVKKANTIDFDNTPEEGHDHNTMALSITDTYEKLLHSFAFGNHFETIISKLIAASNGPNATNRNKALRGLSHISEVNGDFLLQIEVRAAVQRCMYDESVHVRDTAVALLGRFSLSHPEQMELLLPSFTEKMQDTGLLVRKRTLRLLKDIYDKSNEQKSNQVIAAVQIVQSVFDEEETVRDLAVENVAQMWFAIFSNIVTKSPSKPRGDKTVFSRQDEEERDDQDWDVIEKQELQSRLNNIVFVADKLRVKPSPVQEILQQIVKKCDEDSLQKQMGQLVNLTIDNIVQLQQTSQDSVAAEDVVKQVEVIALLVQTNPLTLSIRKAKLLLPYMRGGTKEVEVRLLGRLLAIFNSCLPTMSGTASSFAKQLQSTLTPLVSKPSHHFSVIEELIKCYCTVICSQTHDFSILIRTMQICYRQVKDIHLKACLQDESIRKAKVLLVTTALLTENADYDRIRKEHSIHAADIDQITPKCISEDVAAFMTRLLDVAPLRMCALQSLRFVCRAHPKLLMGDSLGTLMESILRKGNNNDRSIVLRTLVNIMEIDMTRFDSEQGVNGREKKKIKEQERSKKVAREELAGESETMGNPITFEIVSRYGNLIQALAIQIPLQKLVLEIVEAIVLRGISHPLQYLSTIVALQTVIDDKWVCTKAQSLHRHLISKSGTSINFRYTIHAKEAWQFQKTRLGLEVSGCTVDRGALFEVWYETIREQRKNRMEFLRALVKAFDVDISRGECSQDDVHYARFLAENLATLSYKLEEEVILVVSELQNILATVGEQVQISVQEEIPVDGEEEDEDDEDEMEQRMDEAEKERAITIGRMSTIMSMALRLLANLCQQYGLTEGRIAKAVDKKASNAGATRKGGVQTLALGALPGAWNRKESVALAKREMNFFDHLLNSEGYGAADADDYDMSD